MTKAVTIEWQFKSASPFSWKTPNHKKIVAASYFWNEKNKGWIDDKLINKDISVVALIHYNQVVDKMFFNNR